jgi:hypothetical protein
MKKLLLLFATALQLFGAAGEVKLGNLNKTTTLNTNAYVVVSQVTSPGVTNTYIILAQNLLNEVIDDSGTIVLYLDSNRVKLYATNIANANISASAAIAASKLDSSVILNTEIDTEGELEAIMGGINLIQSAEIDTLAELQTLMGGINIIQSTEMDTEAELEALVGGLDILFKTEIDTQAEFESKLFTLPTGGGGGSGDDVYIAGGNVTNPNFANGTNFIFVNPSSSNVYGFPTNIVSAQITDDTITASDLAADSVSASELNGAGVESELEGLLDLQDLQGTLTTGQLPTTVTLDAEWDTIGEIETVTGVNIIVSTEIDSLSEIETLAGSINIIQSTEIDTLAELETLMSGINILTATEIDTQAELEAIVGGLDILFKTEIDTQAEFESKLFTLPTGSTANWAAVGTTNSSLTGIAFAHQLQVTNGIIIISGTAESYLELQENTAPGAGASGYSRLYVKSDGYFYSKDDAGTETRLNNLTESEIEAIVDLQDLQGAVTTAQLPSGATLDAEWDTIAEIETVTGVNIIVSTEIDTSSELLAILTDETGTGSLVFGTSPTLTTPNIGNADTTLSRSAAGILAAEGVDIPTISSTHTLSNKTIDESNNTIAWTEYLSFVYPAAIDGTGTTIITNNYSSLSSGLVTFNGTGETNANYAWFYVGVVPRDFDSGTAWTLTDLNISVSGTDTDAVQFDIAFYQPSSSGAAYPTSWSSASTPIRMTTGTLTSPAANDAFFINSQTLTGWAGTLTAGRPLIIGIARVNNANDDSVTVTSGMLSFKRTK